MPMMRWLWQVLLGKRTVVLPRIVSWYSDDFVLNDNGLGSSGSSSLGCLLNVKRYLAG